MRTYAQDVIQSIGKCVVGMAGSGIALASAMLDAVYRWLPWGLGIVIAVGTAINVWLDVRRKLRHKDES